MREKKNYEIRNLFLFLFYTVQREDAQCSQLKVEIEDEREARLKSRVY